MRSLPALGNTDSLVCLGQPTSVTAAWATVVGEIMTVLGDDPSGHCYFDPVHGVLKSMDEARSSHVDGTVLSDLIHSQLVFSGESVLVSWLFA